MDIYNKVIEDIKQKANDPDYQKQLKEYEKKVEESKKWQAKVTALNQLETIGINYKKWINKKFETKRDYQKQMLDFAKMFAKSPEKGIIITGQTGAGKTHLLTKVFVGLVYRGKKGRYFKWLEQGAYFKSIKNDWNYSPELNEYKKAKLLYIDDFLKVGKNGSPTEADLSLAFDILDYRKENELPTMISCERSIEEILDIDEAVGGRLMECCTIRVELADFKNVKNYRK